MGVLGCRWLAEALTSVVQHDEEGLQGCCRQYTSCTYQVSHSGARGKIFAEPITELKTIRLGGYSCGVARCQTCHDFVLVVCLLEPIVQVHFASFQMQLGKDPVEAGS